MFNDLLILGFLKLRVTYPEVISQLVPDPFVGDFFFGRSSGQNTNLPGIPTGLVQLFDPLGSAGSFTRGQGIISIL